jgi:hypothetical protein
MKTYIHAETRKLLTRENDKTYFLSIQTVSLTYLCSDNVKICM